MESDSISKDFSKDLIERVRNFPQLWDKRAIDYRDCEKGKNSWESVSKLVGKSIDECTVRWKSLRDAYKSVQFLSNCEIS